MADQFAEAFKRYWVVIVTVAGFTLAGAGTVYKISDDFNRVMAGVQHELYETKLDVRELQVKIDNLINERIDK